MIKSCNLISFSHLIKSSFFYSTPLFVIFLLSSVTFLNAQETRLISGKIEIDSLQSLSGVHIINLTLEKGTTSNAKGEFQILAGKNDSLYFSSVQFEARFIRISESVFNSRNMNVVLNRAINELDEVSISDMNLSGRLESDISKLDLFDYEKYNIPRPKKSMPNKIDRALGGYSGPLGLLIGSINGDIKMWKKAQANSKLKNLAIKAENSISENFFTDDLKIPEDEIINFMYYCARMPEFEELIANKDLPALVNFFTSKVKEFMEIRELD